MLNRRDFIRRLVGGGVGVALAPSVLLGFSAPTVAYSPAWKEVSFDWTAVDRIWREPESVYGREWFEGIVVARSADDGVIRLPDGAEFLFTNRCLCRDMTYYEKTVVGCTVYFVTRTRGIAEGVSWQRPSGKTGRQMIEESVARAVQSLSDRIGAEMVKRYSVLYL